MWPQLYLSIGDSPNVSVEENKHSEYSRVRVSEQSSFSPLSSRRDGSGSGVRTTTADDK